MDSNLYFKVEGGSPLMLLLYVIDLFLIGKIMCVNERRPCMSSEDLNLCYKVEDEIPYARWIHRILVAEEATCHSST